MTDEEPGRSTERLGDAASSPPDDAELVRRLRSGDRAALGLLVRRWEGSVYRIAYRVLGRDCDAEEVRQAVFLRLVERPTAVRHADRFAAWIHRTTINTAINYDRRRRRHWNLAARLGPKQRGSRDASPDDHALWADERRQLARALGQLSPRQRALLAMRFDEGLTMAQMAASLGRPVSTVKSQVQRAIAQLRAIMAPGDATAE